MMLSTWARSALLVLVCAAVLLANLRWRFDVNVPPQYTPNVKNKASYPKVYVHFVTALAATLGVVLLGVPFIVAAIVLAFAAVAFEHTQGGTIDVYDIASAVAGIILAGVLLA